MVDTPAGPQAIETLQVGDPIFAVDPLTGQRVETNISHVFSKSQDSYLIVHTDDGGRVEATAQHPFYNAVTNTFAELGSFAVQDQLVRVTAAGRQIVTIEKIEVIDQTVPVYDLGVSHDLHTFLAEQYVVHNKTVTPSPTSTPLALPVRDCPPTCTNIDLSRANLQKNDFSNTDWQGANLEGAHLDDANLQGADLSEANLFGAALWRTDLQQAKLQNANLQWIRPFEANFSGADLRGANLQNVNLQHTQLRGAIYNQATQWPPDFEPDQAGAIFQE